MELQSLNYSFRAVATYDKLVRMNFQNGFEWFGWKEDLWRRCEMTTRVRGMGGRGSGMGGGKRARPNEGMGWAGNACYQWVREGICNFEHGGKEACKFEHDERMKGLVAKK
jgi:hypothetical protein